jgi:hypothetical protein
MIAYDKSLLEATFLIDETQILEEAAFITNEQAVTHCKDLNALKSQKNLLIRIGLYVLGVILYSSICGTFSLFAMSAIEHYYQILFLLFGIIGVIGSEYMSRSLNYFGYGLDDAFVLGANMWLCVAIGTITKGDELLICLTIVLVSGISYWRYLHAYSILICCIGIAGCVFYGAYNLGAIGKMIIPFALMITAVILYFISKKGKSKITLPYFSKGIQVVYGFSLVLFYVAGNYFVVRELSIELMGTVIAVGKDIPYAIVFYAFTILIPLGYLVFSLIKKDRIMLWIGLLSFVSTIFTIRYYYHLLPIEVALTLGGMILFVFTYFSIKKLKHNATGVTYRPDRYQNQSFANAETLLVATKFGIQPEAPVPENKIDFGGGGYSGGGSSGQF